jgi:hypothetical protein
MENKHEDFLEKTTYLQVGKTPYYYADIINYGWRLELIYKQMLYVINHFESLKDAYHWLAKNEFDLGNFTIENIIKISDNGKYDGICFNDFEIKTAGNYYESRGWWQLFKIIPIEHLTHNID